MLVELRHAPDPRVLLEVALVQLTNDEARHRPRRAAGADRAPGAQVKQLRGSARRAPAAVQTADVDPATGRAVLGGAPARRSRRRRQPSAGGQRHAVAADTGRSGAGERRADGAGGVGADREGPGQADHGRALYSAGSFVGQQRRGLVVQRRRTRPTGAKCQEHRAAVEAALATVVGEPVTVEFVVGGSPAPPTTRGARRAAHGRHRPADDQAVEEIDLSELTDAPPEVPRRSTACRGVPGLRVRDESLTPAIRSSHDMASAYTPPVQALIDELGRLPGIGPKSAQRIAFHLLKVSRRRRQPARRRRSRDAKAKVRFCARCFNFADGQLCPICADDRRDPTVRVRRRGVARHRRDRAHRRVPRPLPRAARGDEPARGHRPRAAQDPRAARPHRARRASRR